MGDILVDRPVEIISAVLKVTEEQIVQMIRQSMLAGNLPFGAAVLHQSSLSPFTVSVNKVQKSPLLHGETNCIREFFLNPSDKRPPTDSCLFFATHEPCALCLSAISWTGFSHVCFLFTHEDIRDLLGMDGDIDILEEVFRVAAPSDTNESLAARPLYNRDNRYFKARSVAELLDQVEGGAEKERLDGEIQRVRSLFDEFARSEGTS
ncbi:cytidine deaminase-like protein [Podospora australis]|uniref:Cytidine deaminase-like protein n=1 Tax=Podospora australis TaxID=1536484 RepID=A0AAN6WJV4_9PEZI|nr:cytidine deaminase-like protein [Podospora australis]